MHLPLALSIGTCSQSQQSPLLASCHPWQLEDPAWSTQIGAFSRTPPSRGKEDRVYILRYRQSSQSALLTRRVSVNSALRCTGVLRSLLRRPTTGRARNSDGERRV